MQYASRLCLMKYSQYMWNGHMDREQNGLLDTAWKLHNPQALKQLVSFPPAYVVRRDVTFSICLSVHTERGAPGQDRVPLPSSSSSLPPGQDRGTPPFVLPLPPWPGQGTPPSTSQDRVPLPSSFPSLPPGQDRGTPPSPSPLGPVRLCGAGSMPLAFT